MLNELKPFRFWCQKVLPLVYDDSLSYYELLCKVVDYLNNTMKAVNALDTEIDNFESQTNRNFDNFTSNMNTNFNKLNNNFNELKSFIDNYFDNLNVQNEIDVKLDQYAADGTLSELIKPYVQNAGVPLFVNRLNEMTDTSRVYVLTSNGHIYTYNGSSWIDSGVNYGISDTIISGGLYIKTKEELPDLNNAENNTFYFINVSGDKPANMPYESGICVLYTYLMDTAQVQIWTDISTQTTYYTRWNVGNGWSNWQSFNYTNFITSGKWIKYPDELSDYNYVPWNITYMVNISDTEQRPANAPVSTGLGFLHTYQFSDNSGGFQVFQDNQTNKFYTRYQTNNRWSEWRTEDMSSYLTSGTWIKFRSEMPDYNNVPWNVSYMVNISDLSYQPDNAPVASSLGFLRTYGFSDGSGGFQIFTNFATSITYYRFNVNNNWSDWRNYDTSNFMTSGTWIKTINELSDYNDVPWNVSYMVNISLQSPNNAPVSTPLAFLWTYGFSDGTGGMQMFINMQNAQMYVRYKAGANWAPWTTKITEVHVGPNQTYTKFSDGLAASTRMGVPLIVHPGTYDLIQEGVSTANQGLQVFQDIYAYEGAIIKAELTEFNNNFSVLNIPRGLRHVTIEGLTMISKNCRYTVHDDLGFGDENSHKYINCHFINEDETITPTQTGRCIGGGFTGNERINIEGCIFESNAEYPVHYHSSSDKNQVGDSYVYLTNCYFKNGTCAIAPFDMLEGYSYTNYMYASNNCVTKLPTLLKGSTTNAKLIEWNNALHN